MNECRHCSFQLYLKQKQRERCAHKKNHERETLYMRACVSNDKTKTKSRSKSSLSLSLSLLFVLSPRSQSPLLRAAANRELQRTQKRLKSARKKTDVFALSFLTFRVLIRP